MTPGTTPVDSFRTTPGEGTDPVIGRVGDLEVVEEVRVEAVMPRVRRTAVVRALLEAHPYEEVAYELVKLENQHQDVGAGLVQALGASLPVAGLFFLTNLAAPVLGFAVGTWSDRMRDRLSLFRVGAVVGLVGWLAMAFATEVWMAFAINLTVLGFAGATSSLIFAAVRDQLTHEPSGADNRVMSAIRMAFDVTPAGWSGSDGSLAAQTLGRKA